MKPILLVIMDGLGINSENDGNAVAGAKTPIMDRIFSEYPFTEIGASGGHVGLPDGQMGNSEVGHLNMGAGRVVYQDFTRISNAIDSGHIKSNLVLNTIISNLESTGKSLHLMGLLSDGGVHSHITHLMALLDMAKCAGLKKVWVHPFMDGRDTPPRSGKKYIEALESHMAAIGLGRIATVMGRFHAMDRDNRWDRIETAYRMMTEGGERWTSTATEAIDRSYEEDRSDEFILPTLIAEDGESSGLVDDGDGIIFFNFRGDRAREISRAFTQKDFKEFTGIKRPRLSSFVCLAEYDATLGLPVAFPPTVMDNLLSDVIEKARMKQLRIAETEKYAHVTFFFNGGEEHAVSGEERILIPSPKDVDTYDEKPAMSAVEVTDVVMDKLEKKEYEIIVLNYANCDMVGHTGVYNAAVKAVETIDTCFGRLVEKTRETGCRLIMTADHGNAEQMINKKTGQPHTAHTTNPVPFVIVDDELKEHSLRSGGKLADIAPTILHLLGLEKPQEMDGKSLLETA
ncbi:MAG: 2,3-bisphosphoglycerate-independent phosphoglycerate mutase [Deltaproteobacteria bacterium]|nr:2,3-bisphosphoglycerate-independent phosphoglycerate mutase [Deltaproteobacteria bacterium]